MRLSLRTGPGRLPGRLVGRSVLTFVAGAVAGLGFFAQACGSAPGIGSGGQCFVVADCAPGLICEAKGNIRICSSNLTSLESELDGGDAGGAAATDTGAGPADTGTSTPTKDAASPG
jgi:hypothetical protein